MGALMLIHGVAHRAWCWNRTRADLLRRGHDVVAVELPVTGLDADHSPFMSLPEQFAELLDGIAASANEDVTRSAC